MADVNRNREKYDAVLDENKRLHTLTGHGGVPTTAFRQEPFFGQDSFDHFFCTLQRNRLTKKKRDTSTPTSSVTTADLLERRLSRK